MDAKDWSKAERFLDKSMKLEETSKAQNMLYKLDTMRRRDAEEKANPTPQNEPEKEPETPKYTAA
jgi:DnaJ family protein B protein 12